MRLAAGDRELKLHELREMRLKEAKADRSRLREIGSWLVPTQKQLMSVTGRLHHAQNRTPNKAHPMLKRLADQIADMEWGSEQQNVVSDSTANIVAKVRYVLGRLSGFITLYDSSLRRVPQDQGEGNRLLDEVLKYAVHAEAALKQMQDALKEDANRSTALIDSLEARIAIEDRKLTS